jgi:hypothetical protein
MISILGYPRLHNLIAQRRPLLSGNFEDFRFTTTGAC